MTTSIQSPLDALAGLLDERRRYEGWITQLDTRRGETPAHVLERVRMDYEHRLRGVTDQLRSRATDLEASASSLAEKVGVLQGEENARRDERAETELRSSVGEFPPEHARELLARSDEAIGRLVGERTALAGELARIQEVLTLVRRPGIEVPLHVDAPVAAAPSPRLTTPTPPPPSGSDGAAAFDELAFLKSVVQPPQAPAPSIENFLQSSNPARRPAQAAAPEGDRQEEAPSLVASATPEGTPAFLKEIPNEQVKTLKCQECGTMNYPTEWYCERCGGELAAM
jgi:hypothetical protein